MNSSSPITTDLLLEILSRLPDDSVARFHCVSKQWASMLDSPYFKSLGKPRLLFAVVENGNENAAKSCGVWSFFSLPQRENPPEILSSTPLVASAEFHVRFSPNSLLINHSFDLRFCSVGYASGLIYIYGNRHQGRPLICNPNTGQYAILPDRYTYRKAYSFFGFDPVDKQYKALSMVYPSGPGRSKILTFGAGDLIWRKIKCLKRLDIKSDGVCINGVLYYLGDTSDYLNDGHVVTSDYVIVCFDIRSEEFTFIDIERFCRLINYKGRLAMIYWEDDVDFYEICYYGKFGMNVQYRNVDEYLEANLDADATNELHVWVLEDVEKQEWSKYAYTWTDDKFIRHHVSIAGVTGSGEIVFSMHKYTSKQPFYVFYFNPERNTFQRVEIKGFGEAFKTDCNVRTFVNHVENLNVDDLKLLKSVHPPLGEPGYVESSDSDSD